MNVSLPVLDGFCPHLLQRQERVFHAVPIVAPRHVNRVGRENIKLLRRIAHAGSLVAFAKQRYRNQRGGAIFLWVLSVFREHLPSVFRERSLGVSRTETPN